MTDRAPSSFEIRRETPADFAAIYQLNCAAFGGEGEAKLVDLLRDGGYLRLSLVAESAGRIVGHIALSDLSIHVGDGRQVAALSLAPMSVSPDMQRQGIGSALVRAALAECAADGHAIVVVLGHPEFYLKFGFSSELASKLSCPYPAPPEAWMALELRLGALAGVQGAVVYPPPFEAVS